MPQVSHWYLLPSWFAITPPLYKFGMAMRAAYPFHKSSGYAFRCMGSPQHLTVPSPPRVTTNSALHVEHVYRFPVSFANCEYLYPSIY